MTMQAKLISRFDDEVIVDSDSDSHAGKTLVTLTVAGSPLVLFPDEARSLAEWLKRAADLAEGV